MKPLVPMLTLMFMLMPVAMKTSLIASSSLTLQGRLAKLRRGLSCAKQDAEEVQPDRAQPDTTASFNHTPKPDPDQWDPQALHAEREAHLETQSAMARRFTLPSLCRRLANIERSPYSLRCTPVQI